MGNCRMKLKFTGVIEKRSGGCGACGKKHTDRVMKTSKTYILPSGITKTFIAGRVEEVSDTDAAFLLLYQYETPEGEIKEVFEVV